MAISGIGVRLPRIEGGNDLLYRLGQGEKLLEEEAGHAVHHSQSGLSRELNWLFPDEVVQMLQNVADVLKLNLGRDHGRPLPNRHYREIIGWLVRPLFVDNPPEQMADLFGRLSQLDKAYFIYLLRMALIEALERRASLPSVPLGVPNDTFGTWSNLLARSWLPLPQNLRYRLR